ncbi:MAG: hypothetical protein ACI9J3_000829 [Parvicellaceae bacterium]|jgi:hypothetical protein
MNAGLPLIMDGNYLQLLNFNISTMAETTQLDKYDHIVLQLIYENKAPLTLTELRVKFWPKTDVDETNVNLLGSVVTKLYVGNLIEKLGKSGYFITVSGRKFIVSKN